VSSDTRAPRRVRIVVVGLVVAIFVAACLPPAGTLFRTTLLMPDGRYPLPLAVGDQTELVVGIEPADGDPAVGSEPLIRTDPADPNAFIVTWIGGACDNDAAIAFRPAGSGYALNLEVHPKIGLGCTAIGILRAVRIRTSTPVPPDLITASATG